MEREPHQFSPELLQMMRHEEREKFLTALKEGASWSQLYSIRNTIRKLNQLIEEATKNQDDPQQLSARSGEKGPRE